MSELCFFDTNIIIYTDDESSPAKHRTADRLFREHQKEGTAVVSLQVMQEYFTTAIRKLAMPPDVAQRKVELLTACNVVQFKSQDVIAAIELHRLIQISFWDAMIVHAARISGAATLYTEDLQHGSILGGVRVKNPFLD